MHPAVLRLYICRIFTSCEPKRLLQSAVHHQLPAVQPLVSQRQPPQGIPLVRVDPSVVDHEIRPIVRQQPGQDLSELPA